MTLAAPEPRERNGSKSLDLKWSLTLRVVAVVCFLVASAVALYGTYRELQQANDEVADVVARQLQMQLFRIDSSIDLPARFPDWGPVIERVQGAGQCIEYVKLDGSNGQSSCVGANRSNEAAPAWFSWLGSRLLTEHTDIGPLSYREKDSGKVVVTALDRLARGDLSYRVETHALAGSGPRFAAARDVIARRGRTCTHAT